MHLAVVLMGKCIFNTVLFLRVFCAQWFIGLPELSAIPLTNPNPSCSYEIHLQKNEFSLGLHLSLLCFLGEIPELYVHDSFVSSRQDDSIVLNSQFSLSQIHRIANRRVLCSVFATRYQDYLTFQPTQTQTGNNQC